MGWKADLRGLARKLGREDGIGEGMDDIGDATPDNLPDGSDGVFGENEITDVFQTGYRRGDKIIRFAMVKVAN